MKYEIPPSTYVSMTNNLFSTTCLVDISYQRGWDVYILGLPLLENYYTVFDLDQAMIGFARSIHSDPVKAENYAYTALASTHTE